MRPAPSLVASDPAGAPAGEDRPAGELAPPGPDSTFEQLVAHALRANPGLEAARERWIAALEQAPQVASLPEPMLMGRIFLEEVQTRVGPQEWAVGLSQRLPWFGKLGLRDEVATARAEAQGQRYLAMALELRTKLASVWYELFYLERAIATVRENRDLLHSLEEVMRTRYAAGAGIYADLVRAQVELGRLDDRLRSLEDLRRPTRARLNAILHREPEAELPTPTHVDVQGSLAATEVLRERLLTRSPVLAALRLEQRAAAGAAELAELEGRPDVTFGIEYVSTGEAVNPGVPGSGDDPVVATIGFGLPIRADRYHAAEREARARQRAAVLSVAEESNRLQAELETELFQARDAERKIGLYRDTLVPRARQSFEATETAFRAGEAGFLDLVDAERVLLEFELELERARTDRARTRARLEALVGGEATEPGDGTAPQRTGEQR